MATSQQFLVCDNSGAANFASWASAISGFIASVGWLQSVDTGQVMWSGMNLTAVSMSGTNATYTYNTFTGLAIAIGRTFTITGMTNSGNNGTFRITALGAGTFTVVNASGVNEAGSTGVVTKYNTVPGSGASIYEIWQPGDNLTNFYLKMQYGNSSGSTNSPWINMNVSTSTNGAGTQTGFLTILVGTALQSYTAPSAVTTYECDFSGNSGRLALLLWRNAPNFAPQIVAVQRSLNSSGTPTGTYATVWLSGNQLAQTPCSGTQQSLHFTIGPAPQLIPRNTNGTNNSGWAALVADFTTQNNSSAFNGSIAISNCFPMVGLWDWPCTVVGIMWGLDALEGVPFNVTNIYGQTKTYIATKTTPLGGTRMAGFAQTNLVASCVEYD